MSYVPFATQFEQRQIDRWLQIEGVPISLTRPAASTRQPGGGYASSGASTVLPAVNRIISTQARQQVGVEGGQGISEPLKMFLLGPVNDDIKQGDTFTHPVTGQIMRIEYIFKESLNVETRAEIVPVSG